MRAIIFSFLVLLGCAPAWAGQTCDTREYPLSAPTERFKDNGDGTVTDIQSRLTWMRCSLGQSWNGSTCTGMPAIYTWQSARDEAARLDRNGGYAGRHDWRVPQIPELAMIVERQCANPRTNIALFPATPAAYFWTATTRRGSGMETFAYVLSFGEQGATYKSKTEVFSVRLVSGGKPM